MTPTIVCGAPATSSVRPMASTDPANCSRQRPSLSTTTRSPRALSSAENVRPASAGTPSIVKNSESTSPSCARCGASAPAKTTWLALTRRYSAMLSNERLSRRQSTKFAPDVPSNWFWSMRCVAITASSCGRAYGSGRNTTPFSTLNIATVAPMPAVRISVTDSVNSRSRASARRPRRTSRAVVSIQNSGLTSRHSSFASSSGPNSAPTRRRASAGVSPSLR